MRRFNEWESWSMKCPNVVCLDRHANQLASLEQFQNQIERKRVQSYV